MKFMRLVHIEFTQRVYIVFRENEFNQVFDGRKDNEYVLRGILVVVKTGW